MAQCGEIGLLGLPVPEEYGGSGLDPLSTALTLEAFGYGCIDGGLVFSLCAHLLSCVVPLWKHGSEEQKRRYLPRLSNGELIGVHAMTEPGSGSDAFALKTRAVCRRRWVSNQRNQDLHLQRPRRRSRNRVCGDRSAEGISRWHNGFSAGEAVLPGSQWGSDSRKWAFARPPFRNSYSTTSTCRRKRCSGGVGAGSAVFTHSMDWERICLFASHIGAMERLLEKSIEYARTRTAVRSGDRQVSGRIAPDRRHESAS